MDLYKQLEENELDDLDLMIDPKNLLLFDYDGGFHNNNNDFNLNADNISISSIMTSLIEANPANQETYIQKNGEILKGESLTNSFISDMTSDGCRENIPTSINNYENKVTVPTNHIISSHSTLGNNMKLMPAIARDQVTGKSMIVNIPCILNEPAKSQDFNLEGFTIDLKTPYNSSPSNLLNNLKLSQSSTTIPITKEEHNYNYISSSHDYPQDSLTSCDNNRSFALVTTPNQISPSSKLDSSLDLMSDYYATGLNDDASNSSGNNNNGINRKDKRLAHNAIEKKYRISINSKINELKALVMNYQPMMMMKEDFNASPANDTGLNGYYPHYTSSADNHDTTNYYKKSENNSCCSTEGTTTNKCNKSSVLQKAIDTIKGLYRENEYMKKELKRLLKGQCSDHNKSSNNVVVTPLPILTTTPLTHNSSLTIPNPYYNHQLANNVLSAAQNSATVLPSLLNINNHNNLLLGGVAGSNFLPFLQPKKPFLEGGGNSIGLNINKSLNNSSGGTPSRHTDYHPNSAPDSYSHHHPLLSNNISSSPKTTAAIISNKIFDVLKLKRKYTTADLRGPPAVGGKMVNNQLPSPPEPDTTTGSCCPNPPLSDITQQESPPLTHPQQSQQLPLTLLGNLYQQIQQNSSSPPTLVTLKGITRGNNNSFVSHPSSTGKNTDTDQITTGSGGGKSVIKDLKRVCLGLSDSSRFVLCCLSFFILFFFPSNDSPPQHQSEAGKYLGGGDGLKSFHHADPLGRKLNSLTTGVKAWSSINKPIDSLKSYYYGWYGKVYLPPSGDSEELGEKLQQLNDILINQSEPGPGGHYRQFRAREFLPFYLNVLISFTLLGIVVWSSLEDFKLGRFRLTTKKKTTSSSVSYDSYKKIFFKRLKFGLFPSCSTSYGSSSTTATESDDYQTTDSLKFHYLSLNDRLGRLTGRKDMPTFEEFIRAANEDLRDLNGNFVLPRNNLITLMAACAWQFLLTVTNDVRHKICRVTKGTFFKRVFNSFRNARSSPNSSRTTHLRPPCKRTTSICISSETENRPIIHEEADEDPFEETADNHLSEPTRRCRLYSSPPPKGSSNNRHETSISLPSSFITPNGFSCFPPEGCISNSSILNCCNKRSVAAIRIMIYQGLTDYMFRSSPATTSLRSTVNLYLWRIYTFLLLYNNLRKNSKLSATPSSNKPQHRTSRQKGDGTENAEEREEDLISLNISKAYLTLGLAYKILYQLITTSCLFPYHYYYSSNYANQKRSKKFLVWCLNQAYDRYKDITCPKVKSAYAWLDSLIARHIFINGPPTTTLPPPSRRKHQSFLPPSSFDEYFVLPVEESDLCARYDLLRLFARNIKLEILRSTFEIHLSPPINQLLANYNNYYPEQSTGAGAETGAYKMDAASPASGHRAVKGDEIIVDILKQSACLDVEKNLPYLLEHLLLLITDSDNSGALNTTKGIGGGSNNYLLNLPLGISDPNSCFSNTKKVNEEEPFGSQEKALLYLIGRDYLCRWWTLALIFSHLLEFDCDILTLTYLHDTILTQFEFTSKRFHGQALMYSLLAKYYLKVLIVHLDEFGKDEDGLKCIVTFISNLCHQSLALLNDEQIKTKASQNTNPINNPLDIRTVLIKYATILSFDTNLTVLEEIVVLVDKIKSSTSVPSDRISIDPAPDIYETLRILNISEIETFVPIYDTYLSSFDNCTGEISSSPNKTFNAKILYHQIMLKLINKSFQEEYPTAEFFEKSAESSSSNKDDESVDEMCYKLRIYLGLPPMPPAQIAQKTAVPTVVMDNNNNTNYYNGKGEDFFSTKSQALLVTRIFDYFSHDTHQPNSHHNNDNSHFNLDRCFGSWEKEFLKHKSSNTFKRYYCPE